MNVTLKTSQPNGPQAGATGTLWGEGVWTDDEWWYNVIFPGFDGYYFLPARMLEIGKCP